MEGNVLLSFVLPSNFRINTERIIIQCYKFSFDKMLIEIHECKKRVLSLMLLSNMIKLKIEPSLRNHIHHSFTSEKSGKRLSKKSSKKNISKNDENRSKGVMQNIGLESLEESLYCSTQQYAS